MKATRKVYFIIIGVNFPLDLSKESKNYYYLYCSGLVSFSSSLTSKENSPNVVYKIFFNIFPATIVIKISVLRMFLLSHFKRSLDKTVKSASYPILI